MDVLVAICNHNFNENAVKLKRFFAPSFATLILDSGSSTTVEEFDVCMPNVYYAGLWNKAVELAYARNAEWLLMCSSDISITRADGFDQYLREAMNDARIGVYSPSLRPDSRGTFAACRNQSSGGIRFVRNCEGFFFLARTNILQRLYPVDPTLNQMGWGLDTAACTMAEKRGYENAIDDRWEIYHPASIHVDEAHTREALRQYVQYEAYLWKAQGLRIRKYRNLHRITGLIPKVWRKGKHYARRLIGRKIMG